MTYTIANILEQAQLELDKITEAKKRKSKSQKRKLRKQKAAEKRNLTATARKARNPFGATKGTANSGAGGHKVKTKFKRKARNNSKLGD